MKHGEPEMNAEIMQETYVWTWRSVLPWMQHSLQTYMLHNEYRAYQMNHGEAEMHAENAKETYAWQRINRLTQAIDIATDATFIANLPAAKRM